MAKAKKARGRKSSPPKARKSARARSPADRAAAIARELARRLGLGAPPKRRTRVKGKSGLAVVRGRRKLRELRGTAPGVAVRKALPKSGQKYLANVRVRIGREWVSLVSLTKDPDRLTYGIPRRIRGILAGKESPKAKVIRRAAKLAPPTITGLEVYVTKDDGRKRRSHKKRRGKGR